MREIDPNKWYQFIKSYPFKWRYYRGPYNTVEEAFIDKQMTTISSPRAIMLGSEYLKLRAEYEERKNALQQSQN